MDIEDIKQRISFFFSNLSANFSFFFDRVNVKLTFNNGQERDLIGILPVFGYVIVILILSGLCLYSFSAPIAKS
jgi:hypothetical protein